MAAGDRDPLQLLTILEVARITRQHRRTIERDLDTGRLRYVKLGTRRKIPRVELERYLGWDGNPDNLSAGTR